MRASKKSVQKHLGDARWQLLLNFDPKSTLRAAWLESEICGLAASLWRTRELGLLMGHTATAQLDPELSWQQRALRQAQPELGVD